MPNSVVVTPSLARTPRSGARIWQLTVIALLGIGPGLAVAQPQYTIQSLAELIGKPGTYTSAAGINNRGDIIGSSFDPQDQSSHWFLFGGGTLTDLSALPDFPNPNLAAINGPGQVAGSYYAPGNPGARAFVYDNGTATDLGTLGGSFSAAKSINNAGTVVGASEPPGTGAYVPFVYQSATMQAYLPLPGFGGGQAYDINNTGTIVGYMEEVPGSGGTTHAFSGTTDLGTLGGSHSAARAINDSGVVVGWAERGDGSVRAFRYEGGSMSALGTIGDVQGSSDALDINSAGAIVGRSSSPTGDHPFLYLAGTMHDLNDLIPAGSGWRLTFDAMLPDQRLVINDAGVIVGNGTIEGCCGQGFVMTPVPEPSTYALLAVGLSGVGLVRARRRRS